jgi:hypothetical protein
MLQAHSRAAYVSNEPHVQWYHFLLSRFVESLHHSTFDVYVKSATQQDEEHVEIRGIVERCFQSALPVVYDFVGSVNLATRELAVTEARQLHYTGQFSENGRVMTLRKDGTSKALHLVHEQTLQHLRAE